MRSIPPRVQVYQENPEAAVLPEITEAEAGDWLPGAVQQPSESSGQVMSANFLQRAQQMNKE